MSVLVTGVPTRKRAKRKLKMSEVDPSGATYSAVEMGGVNKCMYTLHNANFSDLLACIRVQVCCQSIVIVCIE